MSTSTGLSLRRALVGMAALLGLLALTVPPATAAEDTTTTFTLASGLLYVTVPADAPLGEIAGSAELLGGTTATSENFGDVTVTDERGDLVAEWTATATGTAFVLLGGDATDPAQTVAAGEVTYDPGVPTVTSGDGVPTPTSATLDVGATVVFSGVGTNAVTWSPSLTFELSETQVSGDYEGTVTHSVS